MNGVGIPELPRRRRVQLHDRRRTEHRSLRERCHKRAERLQTFAVVLYKLTNSFAMGRVTHMPGLRVRVLTSPLALLPRTIQTTYNSLSNKAGRAFQATNRH